LAPLVAAIVFDYRGLKPFVWFFYGVLIALLIGLRFAGAASHGARLWYALGPFNFQPAEPGKIVVVLVLARYLAARADDFRGLRQTFAPLAIVGAPMLLIMAQPDFGTAVVLAPITAAMFWAAGLRKRVFVLFLLVSSVAAVAYYPHLKDYQKERIRTLFNPEADPRGSGYNIIQARTALGSGQLFGKGWGKGTQTALRFLPEYHTDFIFPTVGEQFGMVGCLVVLALLGMLIMRMVHLAQVTQDMFGVLAITGLATMLATHSVMNVGMTVGLLPVTGLPLPFFSYGGTFMLTCLTSIGLTVGIGARRDL
jgi:rod shape determining protein RodA